MLSYMEQEMNASVDQGAPETARLGEDDFGGDAYGKKLFYVHNIISNIPYLTIHIWLQRATKLDPMTSQCNLLLPICLVS